MKDLSQKRLVQIGIIATMALVLGIYWVARNTGNDRRIAAANNADETLAKAKPAEPTFLYEIQIDSLNVVQQNVKSGDVFADYLYKFGFSFADIFSLSKICTPFLDLRRIVAGKPYTTFTSAKDTSQLLYFVYEKNPVDYVVFDFTDTINKVYEKRKEVTTITRTASGTINSSLYQAIDDAGLNPAIAVNLSEVFAYAIDFYHIQQGDFFKLLVEEQLVEGENIGQNKILAAVFKHKGELYQAYWYESTDGKAFGYYDEKGQEMKRMFLKSPLKFGRISSRYSKNRYHPVQKRNKPHLGTDYAAGHGTPIHSTSNGTVLEARRSTFNGNYVKIKHNSTYTTQYLHMSKFASGIRPGARVSQGQVIGYVGSTGLATGPHVCYRFWKNGKQVDPLHEKTPTAGPLPAAYKPDFLLKLPNLQQVLEGIEVKDGVETKVIGEVQQASMIP